MLDYNASTPEGQAMQAYKIISDKSNSNVFIQGLSGVFGFPYTLIADGAVIFTHYAPLINDIRANFNRQPLDDGRTVDIIKKISKEILSDIVTDKILGNVPVAGIYFNAISAKAMTWRIGILFSVLSARGEEIEDEKLESIVALIRNVFPQSDTFKFKNPDYDVFMKLVSSVSDNDFETFNSKIDRAMDAFN